MDFRKVQTNETIELLAANDTQIFRLIFRELTGIWLMGVCLA
jgi:hypothetical protein